MYITASKYPGAIAAPRFPSPSWNTTTARRLLSYYQQRDDANFICHLLWPIQRLIPRTYQFWLDRYDSACSSISILNGGW